MKKIHVVMLLIAMVFSSCNPRILTSVSNNYRPLDYEQEIVVLELDEEEPDDAKLLGRVKIGDTGFTTNCSYDVVIDKAKMEARKVGGNAIKIVDHRLPSLMGSTCHRITAKILQIEDIEYYMEDYDEDFYEEDIVEYGDYQHFRFALNGGYSYMTAKIAESVPAELKNYTKELKSGYHFGGDITYYFTESLGFGGKCVVFKSSNSMNISIEDTYGDRVYGKMSDNITNLFIGPMFSTTFLDWNQNNAFILNLSLGYMGYKNNGVLIDKLIIKGNTMGFSWDIGYDISLSEKFSLGLQLSLTSGVLSKLKFSDGIRTETIKLEKGEHENLSRIDFSIGLRFNR